MSSYRLLLFSVFCIAVESSIRCTEKPRGLIVWPHGGPHTCFGSEWSSMIAGFLACGFASLLINYRGSTGYGDASIHSLPGNIGKNDVNDCLQATNCALDALEEAGFGKLPPVLFGGSHGGFLTLWLAAVKASKFRAAVARNPVTHLTSMVDTSDIPDWCLVEANGPINQYDDVPTYNCSLEHMLTGDDINHLYHSSPISALTSNWKVPLLLCLGAKDKRVPPSQGLHFYRKLKALAPSVPCEAVLYPHDSHPLDSPTSAKDVFLRTITWYQQHLNLQSEEESL